MQLYTYLLSRRKESFFMLLSKGNKCGLAYAMTDRIDCAYATHIKGHPRVTAYNSLCIGCLGEGVGKASNDENMYCKNSFSVCPSL
ncbi:mCG147661 [Mus musculus]|nr:mCG147661 [Mus musculus]